MIKLYTEGLKRAFGERKKERIGRSHADLHYPDAQKVRVTDTWDEELHWIQIHYPLKVSLRFGKQPHGPGRGF